jgi:hypothetical protein
MEAVLNAPISIKEAAELTGINEWIISQAIQKKRLIPVSYRDRRFWLLLKDVQAWIDEYKPEIHGDGGIRIGRKCVNCKRDDVPVFAKDHCKGCYNYLIRNGKERDTSKIKSDGRSKVDNTAPLIDSKGREWITRKAAAEMIDVDHGYIISLCNNDKIDWTQLEGERIVRVVKAEVLEYAKNHPKRR